MRPGLPERSTSCSKAAFAKAVKVLPGGVSSPVRAFKAVGGTPLFIKQANGCHITDIDGNTYIDYVGSYGPLIAGHANERVEAALCKAIGRGTSFGAPPRRKSSSPPPSAPPCRRWRWSGSSTAAPKRR